MDMHGEAGLVASVAPEPASVLDAGCGTGRVAIELHRRGRRVVGIDLDPSMLEVARRKAPYIPWIQSDLAGPDLSVDQPFDAVVLAGNVLIFLTPGTESDVVSNLAGLLAPG